MITEVQKYRANTFQIIGLGFMAPFGKLILKVFNLEAIAINLYLATILALSLFCSYLGIILIVKGMNILEGKE